MYGNGPQSTMTNKGSLPVQNNSSCDSDGDIVVELEQKRKQFDEEIASFRAQKENEFQEFEKDLRTRRRRKNTSPPPGGRSGQRNGLEKPPSRTSSSSALNLLAGHAAPKQFQFSNASKTRRADGTAQRTSKAGPTASQPVVSLDKLNIQGENALPQSGRPRTPPTPILLSKTLTQSSPGSSIAISPSSSRKQSSLTNAVRTSPPLSPKEEKKRNSLTGLFTPSYLPLIDSKSSSQHESSSVLETPPAEDEIATAPSSFKSGILSEILPLSSSSFPPHVTMSPGGHVHASKRAYTAPTVSPSRIPSALRTASGGTIVRKPKHVTFRLADSAIVEPSSSYEEGPSPQLEGETAEKPPSGTRSPLRKGKSSQLHRSLSPDEEDAEAGVEPGMGMGDVIQRLNDYTVAEAAKHGEDLVLEVAEDEQDEDDEDGEDDEDLPMELSTHAEDAEEDDTDRHLDINYHEHEDETSGDVDDDEDGYFSPKAKHLSTMSSAARGNSPITPYREDNWAELSSSDKDRLLFEARRHSDDSDELHRRSANKISTPTFDETGFSRGLGQSVDGGSNVGFFELDEELASPDAGQARPFEFELEVDEPEAEDIEEIEGMEDADSVGLGLSTTGGKDVTLDEKKRWSSDSMSKFGVGSVPINIVRPSLSVSSSWVGTFGH